MLARQPFFTSFLYFFDLLFIIIRLLFCLSTTFKLVFMLTSWLTIAVRILSVLGQERTSERPQGDCPSSTVARRVRGRS